MREKSNLAIRSKKSTTYLTLINQIKILLLIVASSGWYPWLDAYSLNNQQQQQQQQQRPVHNNNSHIARTHLEHNSSPSPSLLTTTPPSSSSSSSLLKEQQQTVLSGFCNGYAFCKSQQNQSNAKKFNNCNCDLNCRLYDDCCSNATTTSHITFNDRISTNVPNDKSARKEWHCFKVNHPFNNILIKAKCPNDWLSRHKYSKAAKLTKKNCEFHTYLNNENDHNHEDELNDDWDSTIEPQRDPMGMMMPITDLITGITFANSHCLLCNRKQLLSLLATNKQQQAELNSKVSDEISSREAIYNDNKPLQPKLIYWTPSLECNYLENDERNTIYDLIKANKGQALEFSHSRKKWIVKKNLTLETPINHHNKTLELLQIKTNNNNYKNQTEPNTDLNDTNISNNDHQDQNLERVCSITPIVPDPIENTLRSCEPNIIDKCRPGAPQGKELSFISVEDLNKAKLECNYGYQATVYSSESGISYFNLGCAKCNYEKKISCYPKQVYVATTSDQQNSMYSPALGGGTGFDVPTIIGNQQQDINNKATSGLARTIHPGGSLVSASISVLFDIYPSSHGDVEIGFSFQCPDNQIYDPFYSKCIDTWNCGLNRKLIDDECTDIVDTNHNNSTDHENISSNIITTTTSPELSLPIKGTTTTTTSGLKWVPKFNFTMANLTAIGLMISIVSLAIYLLLYILSTFDLRPLVVGMANYNHNNNNNRSPSLERIKLSRDSGNIESYSAKSAYIGDRSQNLASRGVACLAASLLIAYILFLFGHRQQSTSSSKTFDEQNGINNNNSSRPIVVEPTSSCFFIAIGTYYFFLVSFNWMFLLSFDIWRILRLATCQLQKPSTKTQSTRFIIYSILALMSAAIIVASSIIFEFIPINCQQQTIDSQARSLESFQQCIMDDKMGQFIFNYRPKFGYRLNSCWFTNRRALAMFFGLPVTLIMFLNLIFFIHSSYMVIKSSTKPTSKKRKQNKTFSSSSSSTSSSSSSTESSTKWFNPFINQKCHSTATTTTKDSTKIKPVNQKDEQNKKINGTSIVARLYSLTTISMPSAEYEQHNNQSTNLDSNNHDYTNQNELTTSSFTSVQTLQSNISSGSTTSSSNSTSNEDFSSASESPQFIFQHEGPEGALKLNNETGVVKTSENCLNNLDNTYKRPSPRPLESTQSSNSLTNQSVGGVSITASLAMRYDTSKQNISLVMNSIGKDYRLYMRLSTIMGLTWFFGLIASIVDQSYLLWYLFIIFNTLQGLFIFIAFGCKKSKLSNVQILISYIKFKCLQLKSEGYYSTLDKSKIENKQLQLQQPKELKH